MPNNLVFNNVANELKTAIYGTTAGGAITAVLVESNGALSVRPLAAATDTVTVTGQVSVVGEVTVVANNLDIRDLSATTDSVLVTGTVEVIRDLSSAHFLETDVSNQTATYILQEDTSAMSMYSFYVKNAGSSTITAQLAVSPTTANGYFVADDTAVGIAQNSAYVFVPKNYLNYTRISFTSGANASIEAYYNAQG